MLTKIIAKTDNILQSGEWLRSLGVTGLAFFMTKGLVWLVAAVWLIV